MKQAVNVAITGAAGQIGYALAFRVASGQMFGPDQPVNLHLLEIPQALPGLRVSSWSWTIAPSRPSTRWSPPMRPKSPSRTAMRPCWSARGPRGPGMERKDLLLANAQIFSAQGKALNAVADRNVKVLVVGNPANTNALIARANAKDLNPRNFTAMTRLDHNRALAQLGQKTGTHISKIRKMIIWGNHSATQYPDVSHATVDGKAATSLVDKKWLEETFIPVVQQRGAAVIKARGSSSAASAASAALDHIRTWALGTAEGDWVSMGVPSDGSYGIPEGVIYSYPVTCRGGEYQIVQGLSIDEGSRKRMTATETELREEREGVKDLLG
ncbi:MAG: malate dehydrogenase [Steroidobacteraceae bacterium]